MFVALVLPVAFGALCGVVLGVSDPWFHALMLGSGAGGLYAGFEHPTPGRGALRGLIGGSSFAASLLVAFHVRGQPQVAWQPAALPVMAVIDALSGVALGALGGALRRAVDGRR